MEPETFVLLAIRLNYVTKEDAKPALDLAAEVESPFVADRGWSTSFLRSGLTSCCL
jgi:hypothetical protein